MIQSIKISILILAAILLYSCGNNNKIKAEIEDSFTGAFLVNDVIILDGDILLLTNIGIVAINNENRSATRISDSNRLKDFEVSNDSLFVSKDHKEYYNAEILKNKLYVDSTLQPVGRFLSSDGIAYEDDQYSISGCCQGEFGGAAYIEYKNNIKYMSIVQATCLDEILRTEFGTIYLVNDLRHGSGFSSIIEINEVDNLYRIYSDEIQYCNHFNELYDEIMPKFDPLVYDSLYNLFLGKGNRKILDTMGIKIFNTEIINVKDLGLIYYSNNEVKYGVLESGEFIYEESVIKNLDIKYGYSKLFRLKGRKIFVVEGISFSNDDRKEKNRVTLVCEINSNGTSIRCNKFQ